MRHDFNVSAAPRSYGETYQERRAQAARDEERWHKLLKARAELLEDEKRRTAGAAHQRHTTIITSGDSYGNW